MEEGKRKELGFMFTDILVLLSTVGLSGLVSWFIRGSATETVRNIVVNTAGCGILIYVIETFKKELKRPGRICLSYLAGLFMCVTGAFLPSFMTPVLSAGLILMLLSDFAVGICAYTLFCMNLIMLSSSAADVFFYYFLTGLFAMAVYVRVEKDHFQIIKPLVMITCISIVLYTALSVLRFFRLTADMVINPAIGLLLNIFILSIALYVYRKNDIDWSREKYKEINDTEYTLLRQLKSHDKDTYFLAVHTAYLCDRIAGRLNLDRSLIRCGAYYQRIGILLDADYHEKNRELMEQNQFPEELIRLTEECNSPDRHPRHKEAAIILMSDAVISGITEKIRKAEEETIDYRKEIDALMNALRDKSFFSECDLTVGELERIQKYFEEETLYYDFLR